MAYNKIASVYDYLMKDIDYDVWFSNYMQFLSRRNVKKVLEIGAGTGNFTTRLLKHFDVHAVEPSGPMLAIARSKNEHPANTHTLTFEQAAMQSFCAGSPERHFDAAVAVFDVLNYCLTLQDLEKTCINIASKLQPDGIFVFDVNTPTAFENDLFDEDFVDPDTNYSHIWQGIYDTETRIIRVEMKIYNNGVFQFKETQHQRAHTQNEITQSLINAGFANIEFYQANDLSRPCDATDRWLVCASKA